MPGASPYYSKAKDIFIQRRTADGKFEEWGVTVQPDSWLFCDSCNNLVTVPLTEFSASHAQTASYFSGSISNADAAISASYALTASHALNSTAGDSVSASWASSSLSSSYPWTGTGSSYVVDPIVYLSGSNVGI